MVDYEGIFFDEDEVKKIQAYETHKLANIHECIHCTFIYKPTDKEIYNELVNKEISVYLTSYGYDENNSGFLIEFPKEYRKYYRNLDKNNNIVKPHITTSISDNGEAKNTRNLTFYPLKEKIKVTGKFGYWIKDGINEYVSFEPYNK